MSDASKEALRAAKLAARKEAARRHASEVHFAGGKAGTILGVSLTTVALVAAAFVAVLLIRRFV